MSGYITVKKGKISMAKKMFGVLESQHLHLFDNDEVTSFLPTHFLDHDLRRLASKTFEAFRSRILESPRDHVFIFSDFA